MRDRAVLAIVSAAALISALCGGSTGLCDAFVLRTGTPRRGSVTRARAGGVSGLRATWIDEQVVHSIVSDAAVDLVDSVELEAVYASIIALWSRRLWGSSGNWVHPSLQGTRGEVCSGRCLNVPTSTVLRQRFHTWFRCFFRRGTLVGLVNIV